MAGRRRRRLVPRRAPARRRPRPARHALHRKPGRQRRRHRHHPRPRGPLRRAARFVAAAEEDGVDDAVHRGPARSQARHGRRRRHPGGDLPRRRPLHDRAVRHRDHRRHPFDPRAGVAGDPHPARPRRPHRRLEDRSGADRRPADRPGALHRAGRRGRAGARLRFHQRAARGRLALRAGRRRRPARRHRGGGRARRRHHLLVQCRAHPFDRARRARRRPPGAGARLLDAARHRRRLRSRLSRRPAGIRLGGGLRLHPAREPRHPVHRQPGRAARGPCQARPRRDEERGAVARRHRRLFLARHPRQREGDPGDQEPADRSGDKDRRGRRRAGPRLGPSAPQRAAPDV